MDNTLFVPARKVISSITNAVRAVVTVTVAHDYLTGEIIRIFIPQATSLEDHGMPQINQQYAPIEVIDSTSFYIDIDTTFYAPFIAPVDQRQYAQTVAIGEVNGLLAGAVHNSLNPQDNI